MSGSKSTPTASRRKIAFSLLFVLIVLLAFHFFPLVRIATEFHTTDGFRAPLDWVPGFVSSLEDQPQVILLFQRLLLPLLVGASVPFVADRALSWRTLVLAAILLVGLGLAFYLSIDLRKDSVSTNWELHGRLPIDLERLQAFTTTMLETTITYLALVLGVAGGMELESRNKETSDGA